MRLLSFGLVMIVVTGCSTPGKNNPRNPSSGSRTLTDCVRNDLVPSWVEAMRKAIAARNGEDFGARCTETDALTMTASKNSVITKTVWKYNTEDCPGYRAEVCEDVDKVWVAQSQNGGHEPEAESGGH